MCRQLVRQATDFAAAHRIGLPGDGERPRPRQPDLAACQMAIDDRIALVGATGRLIHALGEQRDHVQLGGKPVIEGLETLHIDIAIPRNRGKRAIVTLRLLDCRIETLGVGLQIEAIGASALGHIGQQAIEEARVATGANAQIQVRDLAAVGQARVDHHDTQQGIVDTRLLEALEQHRVIPGQIAADQHHQLGTLEILVAARHGVCPEGTLVRHDRRGHAQPRIGIQVRRTDEALEQLVGEVIVLGQQLPRQIGGDAVTTMGAAQLTEASGDQLQCRIPAHLSQHACGIAYLRLRQTAAG